MKQLLFVFCLLSLSAGPLWGYDAEKAARYEALFAPFAGAATPKALARVTPEQVTDWIKAGEAVVLLDVRTPAERQVLALGNPGTLAIPMNAVFQPENLARIPTDQKVVTLCQAGLRCTMITAALRDIGFENVKALKGGLIALITYLNAKTAYQAPAVAPTDPSR